MKKNYFVIALSILAIAALSAAIVSAGHHPANKHDNKQDMSAASISLTSADHHHGAESCSVCHVHGGYIPDLHSISKPLNTPNNGRKPNNQRDMSVACILPASALTGDCGDIYVNETGWWRDSGAFNASGTPIQAAIDNATAGETIYVYNGSYTENVNINKRLTLEGEGADVVTVTNSTANNHVFEVTADYVNISGFNVTGATGSNMAGIYLNSREHCNISGNNASGNYYGIYILSSSDNTLTGNTANLNTQYGIYLRGSSDNTLTSNTGNSNNLGIFLFSLSNNNTLTNNNASNNSQQGIYLWSSSDNTLTSNTGNSNNLGVSLRGSSNNMLTGNTANLNTQHGIFIYSSSNNTLTSNTGNSNNLGIFLFSLSNNNTLTNNNASNNSQQGIYLWSSSDNTLTSNTGNSNNLGVSLRGSSNNMLTGNTANLNTQHGIFIYSSSNNTLTSNTGNSNNLGIFLFSLSNNNTLTNNNASNNSQQGIYLWSSSNNTLTSNTGSSNNLGISLRSSSDNMLTGNTANLNTQHGIFIYSSSNNTLTSNTANSNNLGIFLFSLSNNNTLTNNNASNNSQQGIYLWSSSNNTLTSNTANSNTHGIYLRTSSNNTIYNNYFNNTNNAYDIEYNIWNTTRTTGTNIIGGSWLGGNYWSDYAGADTTSDDLGDTLLPYSSSGNILNGGDYHPLVTPGFVAPNIMSSAPPTSVSDTVGATRTFDITVSQTVNATWYINGSIVQPNTIASTEVAYTNASAVTGYWNVSVLVNNTNGTDMQTWWWTVMQPGAPNIISYAPATPVISNEGATRTFNIIVNQTVNATWYINGSIVQPNTIASTEVAYTNASAVTGYWNVSVLVNNTNGADMQTWWWTVNAAQTTSDEYHHVDSCVVCHDMDGSSSNLHLVFEVLNTPNSGPKDVIFTAYEGPNSYADGDTTYDGVCEVCHTITNHHQNDGTNPDPDHYAGTDCIECHAHSDEFSHGGTCEECHGHDLGYEYEPGKFSEGAGTVQSHSTHTETDSDDLKGPNIACDDCHDTDNYPYFKSGLGDAPYDLTETNVCDDCHSAGGSINGINDAAVGAKENWDNGIYDSEGATLQSGKDKWCAGCHDDEPAIIVVPAPNIVGQSVLADDGNWQTPGAIVEDNGIVGGNTTMPDAEILIDGNLNTGISAGKIGYTVVFDLGGSVDVSHIRLYTENNTNTVRPPTVHWLVYGSNDLEGEWTRVLLGQSVMFARPSWLTGVEDGWDESRLDKIIPVRYIKLEKRNIWPCGVNTQREFQYKVDLQYGYYETGHKIECDNCHDISSAHFDGISQTYNASLNNYQAGYRLRNVTVNGESVYPMEIPRLGPDRRFYETNNDFALCFDCHDRSKLFGYANGTGEFSKDPLETNFFNENKLDAGGNPVNQHRVHITGLGWCGTGLTWDSDWNSTAEDWNMSYDSQMSCTACHNVHGSPSLAMTRHGELISTPGTMDKAPLLNVKYINADGTLDSGDGSYNILETFGVQTQFYLPGRGNPGKNNMCLMCHNELLIYHRDPVIVPLPD